MEILTLTEIERHIGVHDSLEKALKSLDAA
jgi:hypothetical protein